MADAPSESPREKLPQSPPNRDELRSEIEGKAMESLPELVQKRLDLIDDIRQENQIDTENLQPKPLSFRRLATRFYETHDMSSATDREQLARLTLNLELLNPAEEEQIS